MSDFNYQEYLKNNPLLQKEVEENKLITESQEIQEEMSFDDDIEHKTNKNDFAFWYRAGARGKAQALKAKELLTKNGIDADYSKGPFYISFENSDVEERVVQQMLRDANLARFVIMRNEDLSEEEIQEGAPSSTMKVSELKAKIKEDIISLLNEEEDEEEDVEVEDDIEMDMDVEEPSMDAEPIGLSKDEQEIQDSLKVAYDNAVAIGDEKLADQIGNSITFFTRTHVVER